MGFDDGQLILKDNGTFYAGQTINGRIAFDQGKHKTIHGIYVSFKGYCKVHWTTQRTRRVNDSNETYTVNHDSYEEYVNNKYFVIGSSDGETELKPGAHEFNFQFLIPENCPSAFEGSDGRIRYRVKAVMVTSGIFSSNKEKETAVRVVAPKDLNLNPYCKQPVEFEIQQTFCCWCVNAGSSQLLVKLPVGGYCPGQVIPIDVQCTNNSTVEILDIKITIKKNVKYIATSSPDTRCERGTVTEIKKGPVPGNTARHWAVEMDVPAMDVYNLDHCRFIDIDYEFKVSSETRDCHEDEEEACPIIFGTIPLVGYQDNIQNPMQDQLPQTTYPSPPIVNQPLATSPYPNSTPYPVVNAPYPNTPNISVVPPYPTTPVNQQYSRSNSPSPYPNSSYPAVNQPYPGNSPVPPYPTGNNSIPGGNTGNSPIPPYPIRGSSPVPPYPVENTSNKSYPGSPVPPYPVENTSNKAYPGSPVPPYPTGNNSNPAEKASGNSPNPPNPIRGSSPVPPYPVDNTPNKAYPGNSPIPPYPETGSSPIPPYSGTGSTVRSTTLLKTGTFGFTFQSGDSVTAPLLPPGANVPFPLSPVSPYASASAPEPGTPDNLDKKPSDMGSTDITSNYPAYNPEFKGEN